MIHKLIEIDDVVCQSHEQVARERTAALPQSGARQRTAALPQSGARHHALRDRQAREKREDVRQTLLAEWLQYNYIL